MVADVFGGRRNPARLRSRRGSWRLLLGLARRQDRPSEGVHNVGGHHIARHGPHGFHTGTGRLRPGLAFPDVLPLLRGCRKCWHLHDRSAAGAGVHPCLQAWLGQCARYDAAARGQHAGRFRSLAATADRRLAWLVLVFMIRYWVPESPRWLMLMGRHEEARQSLAWALMIDPKEIVLPSTVAVVKKKTRWVELFKYPRLVAAGCLTGLTQTGGASLGLWGPTLLVLVLVPKITPEHAAFLMIFVNVAGIIGRFSITALIEPLGRRGSGTLYCVLAAILMVLAGYMHDVYIGGTSLFYILIVAQGFFGSAVYAVVGPYMAEIWPARLRASGMGLSYGVGNCGKFIGPLGLALIMGAGDLIKPAAPNLVMLGPALSYFAAWYILGVIGFWAFGFEPKGRTFDEIDRTHDALAPAVAMAARASAG